MKRFLSLTIIITIILSIFIFPVKSYSATITSQAGVVSLSGGSLNVRKGASTSSVVLTSLPKGSYIVWKYKNSNFDVEEAENGMKLIATAENKGWTVFTATLYDVDGNVLATDSVELYSKSGLFDKIGSFFRALFGATKIYDK